MTPPATLGDASLVWSKFLVTVKEPGNQSVFVFVNTFLRINYLLGGPLLDGKCVITGNIAGRVRWGGGEDQLAGRHWVLCGHTKSFNGP